MTVPAELSLRRTLRQINGEGSTAKATLPGYREMANTANVDSEAMCYLSFGRV